MSIWEEYDIESKVRAILTDQEYSIPNHHFGKPFMSGYQIAIEFAKRYPDVLEQLGYPIGGRGTGQQFSLSSYITGQLSTRINNGQITDIEGGFFSNLHLRDVVFKNRRTIIHSSLTGSEYDLSIYRVTQS